MRAYACTCMGIHELFWQHLNLLGKFIYPHTISRHPHLSIPGILPRHPAACACFVTVVFTMIHKWFMEFRSLSSSPPSYLMLTGTLDILQLCAEPLSFSYTSLVHVPAPNFQSAIQVEFNRVALGFSHVGVAVVVWCGLLFLYYVVEVDIFGDTASLLRLGRGLLPSNTVIMTCAPTNNIWRVAQVFLLFFFFFFLYSLFFVPRQGRVGRQFSLRSRRHLPWMLPGGVFCDSSWFLRPDYSLFWRLRICRVEIWGVPGLSSFFVPLSLAM